MNYHKVADHPDIFYPEISTDIFAKQIKHLALNYNIVPLDELFDRIKNHRPLKGCVSLTFDDGFKDNYTNAFPILKQYGASATIFLISECIETGNTPWFINFRHAFSTTRKKEINLDLGTLKLNLPLSSNQEKFRAADVVMDYLRKCSNTERLGFLPDIYKTLEYLQKDKLSDMMLTWDQIKEMEKNGISFGAHTHTHPIMSSLLTEEADNEIKRSKEIIEANLGKKVTSFAYPVGLKTNYKEEQFKILKKYGFKYAVTTSKEPLTHQFKPYEISRPYPWEMSCISN